MNVNRFLSGVAVILLVFLGYSVYLRAAVADIESLLMCANEEISLPFVPSALCEFYFARIHDNDDDISVLNDSVGVGWALLPEKDYYNLSLLRAMVDKGVDVNAIDRQSGLAALHAMILERDPTGVRILLEYGARKDLPSSVPVIFGDQELRTPIEMAAFLYERDRSEVMAEIVGLLESS